MRIFDAILTSRWNKPFPVTLLPSLITFYLTEKQQTRHRELMAAVTQIHADTKRDLSPQSGRPAADVAASGSPAAST